MTPEQQRRVIALLRAGRARCANGGWIGPPMTMTHRREICDARDEAATFFDLLGSLEASSPAPEDLVHAWEILDSLTDGTALLWEEQPGRTASEVLELFSRAIARATALLEFSKGTA